MNNNTILKKRWKEIDKELSLFDNKNKKLNKEFLENIQRVFDSIDFTYEDLYNYASDSTLKRFRSRLATIESKYKLAGYIGYRLKEYGKKKKLRNNDILIAMLMLEYYIQYKEQETIENTYFEEISSIAYQEAYAEAVAVMPESKKPKKRRGLEIPGLLALSFLTLPYYNGYSWKDMKEGNISYNVNHLIKVAMIEMQQGKVLDAYNGPINKEITKQNNNYLTKKKDPLEYDQYYGMLDTTTVYLANKMAVQAMADVGIEKVRFVAVIDSKTTDMCESLNEQEFYLYEWNTYSRYSAVDGRNVIYTTKGLEVGANLPPIDNHPHHCRSTIYPIWE